MFGLGALFVLLALSLQFNGHNSSILAMDVGILEKKLGYEFRDKGLLVQALTHPSADSKAETRVTYERLEFLGDAVLELAVTQYLYAAMPRSPEGLLTQLRSRVVSRANLGQVGFSLGLEQFILLGKGEEKAGGRSKNSIVANTFESVFGAMSLDSDYETTKQIALRVLQDSLKQLAANPADVNPKGELQSILQAVLPETPTYQTTEIGARDADDRFLAEVHWHGALIGSGYGSSKRKAEVAAASNALALKKWQSLC